MIFDLEVTSFVDEEILYKNQTDVTIKYLLPIELPKEAISIKDYDAFEFKV